MTRLSDEDVLDQFLALMGEKPAVGFMRTILVRFVAGARQHEPRINSGVHLCDYCMVCDEDDTMETFYGRDYFDRGKPTTAEEPECRPRSQTESTN